MFEGFCPDGLWDDDQLWLPTGPRFTDCFMNIGFIWGPCIFLAFFSLFDVYFRSKSRYSDIPWSFLNLSKMLLVILLIALSIIDLVVMLGTTAVTIYNVQIVSVSMKIATFFLALFLQYYHKVKGHRTSGLLFNFWIILMISAIPQLLLEINYDANSANEWEQFQYINFIIYFTLITLMLLLNCFADKPARSTTYRKSDNPSPELSSSFLRQLFFQWFDKICLIGWRRPLTEKDMYDINPMDTSHEIVPVFDKHFYASVEKGRRKQQRKSGNKSNIPNVETSKQTDGSILPAMMKTFGGPFWFAGFIQLIINGLTLASPMLLNELITYVMNRMPVPWHGWLMVASLFLVAFLLAIFNSVYFKATFVVGFRIRTALISAIYRKSLRISSAAKKDTTVGEIVNLMSVDAQRFFELISYVHVLWSGPMIIGIAIYLIWQQLTFGVISGILVMILITPLSGVIAAKLRNLQVEQMKIKDERVKSMNEILNGMKVLKLYAWEPSFEKLIKEIRERELVVMRKGAILNAGTYFVWTLAPFLVQLASYITFVLLGGTLTANKAFVSAALFNILRFPMAMFPMMIANMAQAWVSVKRINKFLNAEELDSSNVTNEPSANALNISNGTFTWGGETTTLKNINLKVKKGNLTAVVGSVGCGKTSLVCALLGEMEKLNGDVNVDGRIAYVSQQAWIQNATLQDNITFGRPFKKEFYNQVIDACALGADLAMLPGGDQTEIGEKGINLSGGQKQRVSLARAVYSQADIYLLDDPLSAVDSHVGKHIFDNLIGENGLLAGKTRLLVTHAVIFLPKVDEIYVIVNGEITESGSYKELLSQKGAFSEFLTQHIQDIEDDEELKELQKAIQDDDLKLVLQRQHSSLSTSAEKSSLNGSIRKRRLSLRRQSDKSEKEVTIAKPSTKLTETEDAGSGAVGFGVYLRYFQSIGLALTIAAISSNIINSGTSIYSSIWLEAWTTDTRVLEPPVNMWWRNFYMIIYAVLGVSQTLALLITSMVFAVGCLRAARDLHNKLLSNVLRLPMSFFDTTPLGRILNRFSKDMDTIDVILPMIFRFWMVMFFAVLSVFVVISYSTVAFLGVAFPMLVIYYFVQRFYVATSRQLKRIESVTRSPIYVHFSETITGQSVIRAWGEEQRFIQESERRVDYNQMMSYPSIIANRWLAVRLEILGAFIVFFAAFFAIIFDIGPSTVGLSISYALQISSTLNMLCRMTTELETNIVAIERVDEYSDVKQEAAWKTIDIDSAWPQNGIVEFKDFQVRYREGLELVLKGISFMVKTQEKIGIVGRTGAGKSSLTLSLFRIIEAAGGKIVIDGIDISTIGLHSLRSRLTIIPQDPVLFSGSLRMNIDPFNSYSDDAIWTALEHSHLKTFVKGLSDGLEYKIAEGGENLSVGQRQLLCLARALLRKTKVLILDEATAAIDIETDELIQKTIRTQFKDCTILTIAHRLNTIMDSDRIIVLDSGIIAEFDTVDALMTNKDSIFYGMAKNAGLVNNPVNEMTIEEAIDEAFRMDDEDDNPKNNSNLNTYL